MDERSLVLAHLVYIRVNIICAKSIPHNILFNATERICVCDEPNWVLSFHIHFFFFFMCIVKCVYVCVLDLFSRALVHGSLQHTCFLRNSQMFNRIFLIRN